jgi:glycosyltransferase involved in cell wall biosynthesis
MRGIIRNLSQPGQYQARALSRITINGQDYPSGRVFDFKGDPNRLQGLAEISLYPSVVRENADRWDVDFPRFKGLSWLSPFSQADGYGALAEEAVLGLLKGGLDVSIANMGWVDPYSLAPLIAERLQAAIKFYSVLLLMTPPDDGMVFTRNVMQEQVLDPVLKKQFRVLYTMFETDNLPPAWPGRINYGADMVFVPSSFLVDSFKKAGIDRPVIHTPTGIDEQLYRPSPRQKARWSGHPKDETVRVLMAATMTRRKNVAGGIEAFKLASEGDPHWQLLIKTQPGHPEFEEFVRKPVQAAADPRITLITERYSRAQMLALYHISDIFLWPSFGEGIGLPPQEAMSCGLEVVAGYHSGALDFISAAVAYPVASDLVQALDFKSNHADDNWGDVGNWWKPRPDEMARQLQTAAKAVGQTARGPKARDFIVKERHQQVTAASIMAALEAHVLPLVAHRQAA